EVLKRRGVENPGQRLVMIRSWNTSTLLIGEREFTEAQIAALKSFCAGRWFDLGWYPGMKGDEANRFNILPQAWLHEGAVQLLGHEAESFFDRYKFDVRPATDDRPHFFHFLKWRTLGELFALREQGGMPLVEQGYLLLVATLAQAVLVSAALILLPLRFAAGSEDAAPEARGRILAYFLAVGTGFMLVEIAFIQKFILFLSHPLFAISVVLTSFLVFAGLGSAWSHRWSEREVLGRVVTGIVVLAAAYLVVLPGVFERLMHLDDTFKVLVSVGLIAPLALLMGMPFPLGLDRVARRAPGWIPWAWGVNGCASVVSAVLATLLAVHAGFSLVVMLALGVYGLAYVAALPLKQTG
nr:SAM-dependent methyltransferase [Xanthomonadales bacterium]NIX14249.1 SAM-dependent methyltransferase [Xanthomonadales bacterium]